MKGICARTAFGIGIDIGVYASGGVGGIVPKVVLACRDGDAVVRTMVDGEVKCCCAVATCCVASGICWGASTRIIGVAVPNEAVTGDNSLNSTIAIIDCQVQSIGTWAAVVV